MFSLCENEHFGLCCDQDFLHNPGILTDHYDFITKDRNFNNILLLSKLYLGTTALPLRPKYVYM